MNSKKIICLASILPIVGFAAGKKEVISVQQTRPNIILFLVDDMGWQDTSVPFWNQTTPLNKRYHTPNMERLANEGMKFTNAYATPVCTPSRTSLLTGMNAAHHGITNWTSPIKDNNSDNKDAQMESAQWMLNGLSPVPGIAILSRNQHISKHLLYVHLLSMPEL